VPAAGLKAGAATYLLKEAVLDDLAGVVRAVYNGARPLSDDVLGRLREIHDAFRAGDAKRAAALFREHVDAAVQAYRAYSNETR